MEAIAGGLPNELWALIARRCDARSLATLASACHVLSDVAGPCLDGCWISLVRASVDVFVDRWEQATSECWDLEWTKYQTDFFICQACYGDRDIGDAGTLDGAHTQSREARWMCDEGVPGHPWAERVCDACAREPREHPDNADGAMWPMRPMRLDMPHVWSVAHLNILVAHSIHSTIPVSDADFAVPRDLIRLLDPRAVEIVNDWANRKTVVRWHNVCPSSVASLRAWMPLCGSYEASAWGSERMRVPMVCCDRASPMWGAIVLIEYDMTYSDVCWRDVSGTAAAWWGIEDSFDAVIARWKRRPTDQQHMDGWVKWVGHVYIDRPRAVRKAERERTRHGKRIMLALDGGVEDPPQ